VINEVMYHTGDDREDAPTAGDDWVELYNTEVLPMDIGDFTLRDGWRRDGRGALQPAEDAVGHEYRFPRGTTLQPLEYLLLRNEESQLTAVFTYPFSLGQRDALQLSAADGTLIDEVHWAPATFPEQDRSIPFMRQGISAGRSPNGCGMVTPLEVPTPSSTNAATQWCRWQQCVGEGQCFDTGLQCVSTGDEMCSESLSCERDGHCSERDGRCLALTLDDCARSCQFCRCALRGDSCTVRDDYVCESPGTCDGGVCPTPFLGDAG
jgi:hypothetical protein